MSRAKGGIFTSILVTIWIIDKMSIINVSMCYIISILFLTWAGTS